MPTYDFLCPDCGEKFELSVPMGTRETTCPKCGCAKAEKRFTAPGVIFKGRGFYKTDSATSSGAKNGGEKESGSTNKEAEKPKTETSASDAKPKDGPSGSTGGHSGCGGGCCHKS